MAKIIAENLKASPDHETLKSEVIDKKNIDFSLVKSEVKEEEQKEKNLDLDESQVRVEPDSLFTDFDSDSDSMGYTSSDSSELSDSDCAEWPSSTLKSIYSPISSIGPEKFKEIADEIKPFEIVGNGMNNLGNTCFLNAVIQSFMHTVDLLQLFPSIDHVSLCDTYKNGFCVICMFRELVDRTMFYERHFVTPEKLVSHLSNFSSDFIRYQQEDAHEFLQCFLNKLESCCNNLEPQEREPFNIVKEAFGGHLVSKLRCCNCGHNSVTHEPLIDFSLEIEDVESVPAALESFTRIEKVEYFCGRCEREVVGEKQLLIDQAPSVAILHLKRFKNDGYVVQKVDKHVSFPLEMDLILCTNEINNIEEMKYDLYAVIVHAGVSLSSGHYYTFIRYAPNEWYKFDDKKVSRVQEDVVLAEKAYIMFYAKRGTPWFSDFIQIYESFKEDIPITSSCIPNNHASDAAADETSPKSELKKIEGNESKDITLQTSSTPGLEICQRESFVNDKKRKMEDSPSRDDRS